MMNECETSPLLFLYVLYRLMVLYWKKLFIKSNLNLFAFKKILDIKVYVFVSVTQLPVEYWPQV